MSQRMLRIGSIYGTRFFNRQMLSRNGLPQEKRIHHSSRWPIVSGDQVQIIEGPEKGKMGQVLAVKRQTNQIIVKDVNVHVRTRKATAYRAGFFYKTESPVHYTNVQLVDPVHNKPTKIRFGKDANGSNVRYSAMSGAVLPKPSAQWARPSQEKLAKRMNKVNDTAPDAVWEVTFKPFTKNWRPNWSFEKDGTRANKDKAHRARETTYKRFEKGMVETAIQHI